MSLQLLHDNKNSCDSLRVITTLSRTLVDHKLGYTPLSKVLSCSLSYQLLSSAIVSISNEKKERKGKKMVTFEIPDFTVTLAHLHSLGTFFSKYKIRCQSFLR